MKIIFLDFDGVINSVDWYKRRAELGMEIPKDSFLRRSCYELDNVPVKLMSDFAEEMNATIVVSSSWRILHTVEELREILNACGWGSAPIVDVTPRSQKGFRGDEVNAWLKDSTKRHIELVEPITHYVIFDDDSDFHPDQHFVHTSWEHGLLPEHIDKAREILLNKPYEV